MYKQLVPDIINIDLHCNSSLKCYHANQLAITGPNQLNQF